MEIRAITRPTTTLLSLLLGTSLLAAAGQAVLASDPSPASGVGPISASEEPCPKDEAAGWDCVTLTLPLDHFNDTGRTIDVTFALLRHKGPGPAKGTWVTITGGPGTAGIWSAADYTASFAPSIRRDYDIVFMDQRGSGMSGGFTCPNAALDWYQTQAGPDDPDGGAALLDAAHTFATDCVTESGVDPTTLPYYATKQAVEDLEAFRVWLGVDQMSLYGESYGTQFVQTYAAAYPGRVKVLFLDGAVDLSVSGPDWYVEDATAMDQTLTGTLLDCTTHATCSRNVAGGNELTTYDALAAQLAKAPATYTFTKADGTQEQRQFTSTDLQTTAADSISSQGDRMLLQRAMAAASHGDYWWLARLDYAGLEQDADTLEAIPDPSWSDALYYAVECLDYPYYPDGGTPDERAQEFLQYGRDHSVFGTRLGSEYTGDLPCVYWPAQPGPDPRPNPNPDAPYPLVVLGAAIDPSTPFPNAIRITDERTDRSNTWLIYQPGGPHVIYGRGNSCPDDLVTRILVAGQFPTTHLVACPGSVADAFVSIPNQNDSWSSTLALLSAYDGELTHGADYWYWDEAKPLSLGCALGGTITYTPTKTGSRLSLDRCSYVYAAYATGTGAIDDDSGAIQLKLRFGGRANEPSGTVTYERNARGQRTVHGSVTFMLGG